MRKVVFCFLLSALLYDTAGRAQDMRVDTLYRVGASQFVRSLGRWKQWEDLVAQSIKRGRAMNEFMARHSADEEGLKFMRVGEAFYDAKSMNRMYEQCAVEIRQDSLLRSRKEVWDRQVKTSEGEKYTDIPVRYKGKQIQLSQMMGRGRFVILTFLPENGLQRENEMAELKKAERVHTMDSVRFVQADSDAFPVYGVSRLPETVIFDRRGMISMRHLQGAEIERALKFHVKQDKASVDYEVDAMFPGGNDALRKFIEENIQYPEEARKEGKEGRVLVSVTVDEDGSLTNVETVRSPDERLTKEALRLIGLMPRWECARIVGEPIKQKLTLPIDFFITTEASSSIQQ